jgi:hypothetical protein
MEVYKQCFLRELVKGNSGTCSSHPAASNHQAYH